MLPIIALKACKELLGLNVRTITRVFTLVCLLGLSHALQAQVIIEIDELVKAEEGPEGSVQLPEIELSISPNFDLQPNPAVDYVKLKVYGPAHLQAIEITNIAGERVFYTTKTSGSVYAEDVVAGTYYFYIYTDQGNASDVLVVE